MTILSGPVPRFPLVVTGILFAAVAWAYWTTLARLAGVWSSDPQYSHGYLVPLCALAILWYRRGALAGADLRPSWLAAPFVLAAVGLRLAGAYFYLTWLDQISLLPALAGVALAAGGRPAVRWAWTAIVFLFFMIPLPGRVEGFLAMPLQHFATAASTNVLQTLGFPAQAEGTMIWLDDGEKEIPLGIVEACNGLRMLVVFFALSTAVALLSPRSWLQRTLLVLSAVPLALVCNVARISLTGILYETVGGELAQFVFHDVSGWLMIPMALALLGAELWLLSHLFVPAQPPDPILNGFPSLPEGPPADYSVRGQEQRALVKSSLEFARLPPGSGED